MTRKWARKDANGNDLVTTYSCDSATGELTGVDYSDSTPDVTFTYDRMGRQREITDVAGSRVFSYNADFSLASEAITGIYVKVLSRNYDSAPGVKGRYAGFEVGDGSPASGNVYRVNYGYDAKGRMNNVSWNVNNVPGSTTYSYLPSSDLLSGMSTVRTDAPGYTPVTAAYVYEPHRDVKTQVLNRAGARTISQYDHRYNSIGNRTSVVNTGEAFAGREGFNLYSYNSRSEVTESKRYRGSNIDDTSQPVYPEYRSYNYDPIGNRETAVDGNETSEVGKSTTYTTNGLNQYETTTVTPNNNESATFTYDADGNMTSIADATGYTLYVFDGENRLIEVRPSAPTLGQKRLTMAYDFMGRRIKKDVYVWTADVGTGGTGTGTGTGSDGTWTLDTSRTFTWDGWLMTDETATASTPNATPDTTSYVWGLDLSQSLQGAAGVGGVIASVEVSQFYCYQYDVNGNVWQLISPIDGSLEAAYEYDSYGSLISARGVKSESNPIRWSSKYSDIETSLVYYGYRYFSPSLERWISKDPLEEGGGINMYTFCYNNPICYIDIFGDECVRLIVNTVANKKSDEYTFEAAAIKMEGYYKRLKKKGVTIIRIKVKSGKEIVEAINSKSNKSIESLDIFSHSNRIGIHMVSITEVYEAPGFGARVWAYLQKKKAKPVKKTLRKYQGLYTDFGSAYEMGRSWDQEEGSGSRYLEDIQFKKFQAKATVEFHGCETAHDNFWNISANFAEKFSAHLISSGVRDAVVIGHIERSNADKENNYQHGSRAKYINGKLEEIIK